MFDQTPFKHKVNGSVVNIPSYQMQAGDEIQVRDNKKGQLRIAAAL
jgi:small subunit ribosomal protein S4